MPRLIPEMQELHGKALDDLFDLGRDLPRGSFRLVAEKYGLSEHTLRAKYWSRTDQRPSPFLRPKRIVINDLKFEANPFQIAEAIKILIRQLRAAEEKNLNLQTEMDLNLKKYNELEQKYRKLLGKKSLNDSLTFHQPTRYTALLSTILLGTGWK